MPQDPWHPKKARYNAKPVPLFSSLRRSAPLCKLKNSHNSGELRPLKEIFLSIKVDYLLLTYIKLYCHLSTLRLSAWSFFVFYFECYAFQLLKIYAPSQWGYKYGINLAFGTNKPILLLGKLSKTLKQKTLTNSKIFHIFEVLSFKEYEKGKAIQTWVGKIYFVSGADYLTKGANLIILNRDKFKILLLVTLYKKEGS